MLKHAWWLPSVAEPHQHHRRTIPGARFCMWFEYSRKAADGSAITLKLAQNAAITAVSKATFADIESGDYVGIGGVPRAEGSQALSLQISLVHAPQCK
jgi:hypothetical protein